MTTLSIRDRHEVGKERTGYQLVCDLSFESFDKLDII